MYEANTRSVSQIKGLRVEYFIYFIENETENEIQYLPENYREMVLNRQWIINLCNNYIFI